MRKTILFIIAFIIAFVIKLPGGSNSLTANFVKGTSHIQSMGTLTFGPEGILFIGDAKGATIYAVDLKDKTPNKNKNALEIKAIDQKIASLIGRHKKEIRIHDIAVNPISQNTYLAVSFGNGDRKSWNPNLINDATILLKITPDGEIGEVSLENILFSKASIANAPGKKDRFSRSKRLKRLFTIRDMAYIDHKLYISGLSNEEFSSSMRIIPFPFSEEMTSASVEFFHGSHGQYETSSPVNTFLNYPIGGEDHLVAAYSCTPLITIPVRQLKPGAHVKARTVAELGAGSHPIDMIAYRKAGKEYILLANSRRGLMKIDPADIAKQKDSLTRWSGIAGVPYQTLVQGEGLKQLENYNDAYVLILQEAGNGSLDLKSLPVRSL